MIGKRKLAMGFVQLLLAFSILPAFLMFFRMAENEVGYFNITNETGAVAGQVNSTPNPYFRKVYFDFKNTMNYCDVGKSCLFKVCVRDAIGNAVPNGNLTLYLNVTHAIGNSTVSTVYEYPMETDIYDGCYFVYLTSDEESLAPFTLKFNHTKYYPIEYSGYLKFYDLKPIEVLLWEGKDRKKRFKPINAYIRAELDTSVDKCLGHKCYFDGRLKDGIAIIDIPYDGVGYTLYYVHEMSDVGIRTKIKLARERLEFGNRYEYVLNPYEVLVIEFARSLKLFVAVIVFIVAFFIFYYFTQSSSIAVIIALIVAGMIYIILP